MPAPSRTIIDLTGASSDEDVLPLPRVPVAAAADESIEFVSEVRRGKRPEVSEARIHATSSRLPASAQSPVASTSQWPAPDSSPLSRIELDSDMGDETRQLLIEMMEGASEPESVSTDEDRMPLAALSLRSPASSLASPAKRTRSKPPKLRLAVPHGGNGDGDDGSNDDDEEGDQDEDDEEDDEDGEPEPDSLFLSPALSRALVAGVRSDSQLWHRILRFEPIPLEELISCGTRSARPSADSRAGSGPASATTHSVAVHPGDHARACKEWDALLAGPQKRLELAIQSWADEQGIASFADESRNDKRRARQARTNTKAGPGGASKTAAPVRRRVARAGSSSPGESEASPSKRTRRASPSSLASHVRSSRGRGRPKKGS